MSHSDYDKKMKAIHDLLENPFWPRDLLPNEMYSVQTDDSDGDSELGFLMIGFGEDGDAHIRVLRPKLGDMCRFRTFNGGGRHPKVRAALIILAEAIRMEQEEEEARSGRKKDKN